MGIWRVWWMFFFLLAFSLVVIFEFSFSPIVFPQFGIFKKNELKIERSDGKQL